MTGELTDAPKTARLYVSGIYPESPSHILNPDGNGVICGTRISVYSRGHAAPQRRVCVKCEKKALLLTENVSP